MNYKTCGFINRCALNFNGRIDEPREHMTFCCEALKKVPGMVMDEPEVSLKKFIQMRNDILIENFNIGLCGEQNGNRKVSAPCEKCSNFVTAQNIENIDNLIHYINLSMYPAPCQCKCIYCNVHSSESGKFDKKKHSEYYENLFALLEYARKEGLIAKDVMWQVSSGEITIHPYRDRIIDLIQNDKACFYTNAFIYDEKIAANLKANPNSSINLSIDAGTPNTWLKIKGVNNFEAVMMNLVNYHNNSSRPGQITLKYIILPGINDNVEDYNSVIEIMKILECKHLTLSRDTSKKYSINEEDEQKLIQAAGQFLLLLSKNNMSVDMFTYTPEEREKIVAYAKKLAGM